MAVPQVAQASRVTRRSPSQTGQVEMVSRGVASKRVVSMGRIVKVRFHFVK
jgi:hypothetical protein